MKQAQMIPFLVTVTEKRLRRVRVLAPSAEKAQDIALEVLVQDIIENPAEGTMSLVAISSPTAADTAADYHVVATPGDWAFVAEEQRAPEGEA